MSDKIDKNKPYIVTRNTKPIASFDDYPSAAAFCKDFENLKGVTPLMLFSTEHGENIACFTTDGDVLRISARELWGDIPESIRNGLIATFQSYGIDPNGHSPFIFWREFDTESLENPPHNILLDMLVAARYKEREVLVKICRDIVDYSMTLFPNFASNNYVEVVER